MRVTHHAKVRGQQRGIKEIHMRLLVAFGKATQVRHNVYEYRMDKEGIKEIELILKLGVQILDKIKNQVLISDDLAVVTCYHV